MGPFCGLGQGFRHPKGPHPRKNRADERKLFIWITHVKVASGNQLKGQDSNLLYNVKTPQCRSYGDMTHPTGWRIQLLNKRMSDSYALVSADHYRRFITAFPISATGEKKKKQSSFQVQHNMWEDLSPGFRQYCFLKAIQVDLEVESVLFCKYQQTRREFHNTSRQKFFENKTQRNLRLPHSLYTCSVQPRMQTCSRSPIGPGCTGAAPCSGAPGGPAACVVRRVSPGPELGWSDAGGSDLHPWVPHTGDNTLSHQHTAAAAQSRAKGAVGWAKARRGEASQDEAQWHETGPGGMELSKCWMFWIPIHTCKQWEMMFPVLVNYVSTFIRNSATFYCEIILKRGRQRSLERALAAGSCHQTFFCAHLKTRCLLWYERWKQRTRRVQVTRFGTAHGVTAAERQQQAQRAAPCSRPSELRGKTKTRVWLSLHRHDKM